MYENSIDYTPVQNQSGQTTSISMNDGTFVPEPLAHTSSIRGLLMELLIHPPNQADANFPLFIRNTCKLLGEILQQFVVLLDDFFLVVGQLKLHTSEGMLNVGSRLSNLGP